MPLTMRFLLPFLLTQSLCPLLMAGNARAQTWEFEYDAALGTLPSAQGFVLFEDDPLPDDGLDEANYSVAAGLLTQGPTGGGSNDDGNRQWYDLTSQSLNFDDDVIEVEFSLRIINSSMNPPPGAGVRAGFGVSVSDRNSERAIVYIGSSGAFLYGSDSATSPLVSFDATDTVHDYVFRLSTSGAALELDGVEIATLDREDYGSVSVPDRFSIGDLTILERSSSELTAFRISRRSAPAPEVRNYQVVTQYSANDSTSPKSLVVACPAGTVALTGGASTSAGPDVGISESYPETGTPPTGWVGSARELVDTGVSWDLRVDVVCGEVSGYERLEVAGTQSTDAYQTALLECNGVKVPFSGGVALSGASLRQTAFQSVFSNPLILGPRWLVGAEDFGAGGVSSGTWGLDVHAICSDATRQEHIEDQGPLIAGSPKSMTVNCLGGKLPIGGGAFGGDGGLEWSRPKDGAPGQPPVGWDAQARGAAPFQIGIQMECAPLADPTVSANGLRSRFKAEFDADDAWGWAHGTLNAGVGFSPGVEGQAFSFDGTNQRWVSIPSQTFNGFDGIDMYPEGDFTVGVWIKTSASSSDPMVIAQLYDFGGGNPMVNWSTWYLSIQPDGLPLGYIRAAVGGISDATIVNGPAALNDGAWHHLAMSRDLADDNLRLYVDGVEVDAQTLVGTSDQPLMPGAPGFGDPVSIGAWREGGTTTLIREFNGEIDDFSYWNRAISLEEIQNVAGCHRAIGPRVLNLDADRFSSPVGAGHTLCVYLEAGPQEFTLVDPAADPAARHTGWSSGPLMQWGTVFSVDPAIDPGFTFGVPESQSSGQAAYDATTDKQVIVTLTQPQRVYFSLIDNTAFDNRGGVSIRVPEPGSVAALVAGVGLLAGLARGRRFDRSGV